MFIVFSQHITTRLEYIVKAILGNDTIITRDILKFSNSSLQKINYSSTNFNEESLWIVPYGLLEEKTVQAQNTTCFEWNGLKAFFKTNGILPFDIFSASFYLLTRYEEYFYDYKTDAYGNYHHENSLAFKEDFLPLPLINLWLKEIEKQYKIKTPNSKFQICPTYDVDIAYCYKHHSLLKNIAGFAKDLIQTRGVLIERFAVLFNYKKDVYDIFDWLHQLHLKNKLNPIYFFLLAKKRSKFDKNALPESKGMIDLIKQISKQDTIGIHPSFKSNKDENILKNEIQNLQKLASKNITISRQHYLQLKFPTTYKTLVEQGIDQDYTMGYGTCNGFRASYTKPFYWYNLLEEKQTTLLLHPFCYMDANSIFEQQFSPENALQEMIVYYNVTKQIDGEFIFIMHNHFLANTKEWLPWKKMYETFLTQISV